MMEWSETQQKQGVLYCNITGGLVVVSVSAMLHTNRLYSLEHKQHTPMFKPFFTS